MGIFGNPSKANRLTYGGSPHKCSHWDTEGLMALQASAPENGFLGVVLYVDLKLKCVFTSHGPIWTRQNLVLGGVPHYDCPMVGP